MGDAEARKAVGAVLSGVGTCLGVAGGAWYFYSQRKRGAFKPNLSLSVGCERRASKEQDTDWLAITATLTKPDRGMLSLNLALARIIEGETVHAVLPLWGARLAARKGQALYKAEGSLDAADLEWEPEPAEPLHLTPGEETQFAAACPVPSDAICQVNVIIRAGQHGEEVAGQWQASAVSLPRERKEEPAQLAAGKAEAEDKMAAAALGDHDPKAGAAHTEAVQTSGDRRKSMVAQVAEFFHWRLFP